MTEANGGSGKRPPEPFTSRPNGLSDLEIERRLTAIETKLQHVATREDIEQIKTLIEQKQNRLLQWSVGIVVAAVVTLLSSAVLVLARVLT